MVESAAPVPGRVFISYRREETAYPAGWLYDRLASRYGGQVFKDVDSIRLGDDFVEVITRAVGSCDVLLALIGDQWLTITDRAGQRRLEDPDDFVRLEIEAALTRDVRVIPILIEGARLPHADELPPSLAKLVRHQALELSPARFDFDTSRLLKVIDQTLAEVRTAHERQGEPNPTPSIEPEPRRDRQVYVAAAALVLAAAGTAATLLIQGRGQSPDKAGRPAGNEITATAAWRLVVSNKVEAGNRGCTVTLTHTDTGEPKVFSNIWGVKTFQMQTAGTFRWDADSPGCFATHRSGPGQATLPFSQKADTGDTDVFAAPKAPGKVAVQIVAFHSYRQCLFELHDAADGRLVDLGTVPQGRGPLRLEPNGRSQVYLADFAGCDVRLSAEP